MDLIFQESPEVQLGTLIFRNVPTLLQFEDTPLIEVKKTESAGYSARFHIFHNDGADLAVVKGSRLFLTEEGKKAGLSLRHEPNLTVCEVSSRTAFELRRTEAAALKGWAELYSPTGILIKATDSLECLMPESEGFTRIGRTGIKNALFIDSPIGIHVYGNGKFSAKFVSSKELGTEVHCSGEEILFPEIDGSRTFVVIERLLPHEMALLRSDAMGEDTDGDEMQ